MYNESTVLQRRSWNCNKAIQTYVSFSTRLFARASTLFTAFSEKLLLASILDLSWGDLFRILYFGSASEGRDGFG